MAKFNIFRVVCGAKLELLMAHVPELMLIEIGTSFGEVRNVFFFNIKLLIS